ncbi:MAG TPA: hypothetical protein VLH79_13685 [Chthonomonadales bacterium]|nr:hypothetical protein [Chthonomonadales bacterium]
MGHEHRCRGCLSRRQCLQFISGAAIAATAASGELAGAAPAVRDRGAQSVDPASLRPAPRVRVAAALLRMPTPYWLGWPGTTFDLDRHSRQVHAHIEASRRALGIDIEVADQPIQDEAGLNSLMQRVAGSRPDALLVVLQHLACWGWVDRLSREVKVPLLVVSPVGTSFTHTMVGISRRPGVYVVSSLEWPTVEDGLRMVRAKRMFEETRILWIHGNQRNETVLDWLGTRVRQIPRHTFNEWFDREPVTAEVRDVAADMRRRARRIVEPTADDAVNAARAYTTAKRLLAAEQANALTMDCLGMVGARLVPTPPCGAFMLLLDQGITAGCEADLFGATSLMLTSYLLGRPGFLSNPVAETAKNLLVSMHCTSGSRLWGFDKRPAPYIMRDHSESSLGVAMQVLWPVGDAVTYVRFTHAGEVAVDTGKVVSNVATPPAGGCRTAIEVAIDGVADVRDVLPLHHQVVALGNHRRVVRSFCQLYGINTIHSPAAAA